MPIYLDLVVLLNFLVDFLLLLGTDRLAGYPTRLGRTVMAAGLGGLYGGACLLPGFSFLGGTLWRTVSLGLMGALAFGFTAGMVRRTVLFVLLSMALGGIALGLGDGSFTALVLAAAGVGLLCLVGFRGRADAQRYIPVELSYGENRVRVMAMQDTGNTLKDPLTGQSVLIVGARTAQKLTGLTPEQLRCPVETIAEGTVSGLRLIPYRTVGKETGMLLALRIHNAKIGSSYKSTLVAFAPEGLGENGEYQALTGGTV